MLRTLGVLAGLCVCAGIAGCGPKPAATGTVSGKVTLSGQPLTAGVVQLLNSQLGTGGSAELDGSGAYKMATPLPVGEYQVAVQPPPQPAPHEMTDAPAKPAVAIPSKFSDPRTSGFSVSIKEGANTANFDLQPN